MGKGMVKTDYGTFSSKIIYVFGIPDSSHEGLLKIGDATYTGSPFDRASMEVAAKKRIDQYTKTAGINYQLLHVDLAIDNKGDFFRDYNVHQVLERSGIKRKIISSTGGQEWFEVNLVITVKAIDAVKNNKPTLSGSEISNQKNDIIFRPEQLRAIKETLESIKAKRPKKLWNAKMRFGKTLTALQVAKEAQFKKTIIITHRPIVSEGWFDDFDKIFHDSEYLFGSRDKGYRLSNLIKNNHPFVYFASMQDLRGSQIVGGNFKKNADIFSIDWDYVIVDEAHEGNKTELAMNVHKNIRRSFTLELSGTPFNLFEDYEDEKDIYTWDYVMEQQAKYRWDEEHFGDSNPYETLPKLSIFTYRLDKEFRSRKFETIEDKAFNFREFFRTIPHDDADFQNRGKFVHEKDVKEFLDLISKKDTISENPTNFPFSTEEYRENLNHTLWLVPGVKEARALSDLMKEHTIFCNFEIVNIAGNGDDDEENENALNMVNHSIGAKPEETYTITITCGRLTTGVSVPAWTGVMMLSNTTSASIYLQTAFRVQTPANIGGQMKTDCYVFDFAPDRTLKMVAEAARLNTNAGRINSEVQKQTMKEFLNYCSIISLDESKMGAINVSRMLRELKRATVDRVVNNGFDDIHLYNDELLKLNETDLRDFDELYNIVGKTSQAKKPNNVTINNQGFDEEEWTKAERGEKRKPKDRTPEEEELYRKMKELRKQKITMISILRGISIRIPLMIFGADIPFDEEITIHNFTNVVDDISWAEFMPQDQKGNLVTKTMFNKFKKYYDEEVFVESGLRIRRKAKAADKSDTVKERVIKIADIFSTFKNPDKETVLTPWKVVNRHLGETLGGEVFFDENYELSISDNEPTRKINSDKATFNNTNGIKSNILEINSKSGLYPLLATYNIYKMLVKEWRLTKDYEVLLPHNHFELWNHALENNIYVIAKTPMAKTITERTLRGYSEIKTNVVYYPNIMIDVKENRQLMLLNLQKMFNQERGEVVKFDVVIGNPPYQEMDGGAQASATPIYQNFVRAAKALNPTYISLITPSRWYVGGKWLDDYRDEMLNDPHIRELHDWLTPDDIFPNTNIRGGVCYFLWDKNYDNNIDQVRVVTHANNTIISNSKRPMKVLNLNIFVRDNIGIDIIYKVFGDSIESSLMDYVSPAKAFGFRGYFVKDEKFRESSKGLNEPIKCYGLRRSIGYVEREEIPSRNEWIDSWKVFTAESNNIGTELNDDNLNTIVAGPKTVCTETYVVIGADLDLTSDGAHYLSKYMHSKFFRYLLSLAKTSQHGTRSTYRFIPIQDFTDNSDIDWSSSIVEVDKMLYKKYALTPEEITHIETKIKSM